MTARTDSPIINRGRQLTLAMVIVIIDQFSKAVIAEQLGDGRTVTAIPGLLELHLVHNTGAAFSLLSNATPWLGLLSLLVAAGLSRWIWRRPQQPLWQGLAVSFLLGGTLGNGLDRWRLGYVVDFLALVPINFPVFNPADIAINLAVACFAIDLLQQPRKPDHG